MRSRRPPSAAARAPELEGSAPRRPSLRGALLRRLAVPALALAVLPLGPTACGGDGTGEAAPGDGAAPAAAAPPFRDATADSGLDFVHFNGMSGEYYYSEMMGSGAALLDHDGDGDLDLFLVQGTMLDPEKTPEQATFPPAEGMRPLVSRLYRNLLAENGELRFEDVTLEAGLGSARGYGMGVAVGDADGDGRPDLYVTYHGPNRLFVNRGDGSFEERPGSGAEDPSWSTSAAFFDADRDGDLDLYVANYVDYSLATHRLCRDLTGAPDYCGPLAYPPQQDRLLENRGDGTFRDVTAAAGMENHPGAGLGVVTGDLDGDGLEDVYVANDGAPNFLWRNRGDGRFEEIGLRSGAALDRDGRAEAGMGVVAGDADGDGDEDLAVTHLALETNTLYANLGGGFFEDVSAASGLGPPSWPLTAFGNAWIDVDHDGRLDFAAVAGGVKVIPELAAAGDPHPLHQPNQLLRNVTPTAVPAAAGPPRFQVLDGAEPFARSEVSRGLAAGDVDGDGDVDLVVSNNAGPARLLLNQAADGRPWLGVRLVIPGDGAVVRDAVGAFATVRHPDGRSLVRRVRTGGSYLSASDPRLVFGLGPAGDWEGGAGERPGADRSALDVEVLWPDGRRERFSGLATGRYHTLRAGDGEAVGSAP